MESFGCRLIRLKNISNVLTYVEFDMIGMKFDIHRIFLRQKKWCALII